MWYQCAQESCLTLFDAALQFRQGLQRMLEDPAGHVGVEVGVTTHVTAHVAAR